jgi:hypothetical protein
MNRGAYFVGLLLITVGAPIVFFGTQSVFISFSQSADGREKHLSRPSMRQEPFEIVSIESDHEPIAVDEKFVRNEDWLKDFSIAFKNKTDKTITSFTLNLFFPETTKTGNIMMYPLIYGTPLPAAIRGERLVKIGPNETFTIKVDEQEFQKLKKFLIRRHELRFLTKIEMRVGFVLFDDGTAWDGQFRIPDPDDPKRFVAPQKPDDKIK